MAEGSTNSRQVARAHLARIEALDSLFGAIRSTALVPDALEQAGESDQHRRLYGPRSPLEGIPVVLKDNIDLVGSPTTGGSAALAASEPAADAYLVRRLREAGAVILAKTNLSELANFLTEDMPSGYSSLGGQVLNPYDLALTPSGSSSGTAVAVALQMAPVGVGTETDGSIISPAVHQSLVGIKPTLGLISRRGILPIAPSQDTAGVMASNVGDAVSLLAALAGPDPGDEATSGAGPTADALRAWVPDPTALHGARLVLVSLSSDPGAGAGTRRPADAETVAALEGAGVRILEAVLPVLPRGDEDLVLHYEFAPAVDAYLAELGDSAPIRSLAELRDWNNAHAGIALKYGQTHVERALAIDHDASRGEYLQARRRDRETVTAALDAGLGGADALVFRGDQGATWAARSGWPSVCVPTGYSHRSRRPLGLTIVARAWSEARLLSLAAGIEKVCGSRSLPSEVNPAVFASRGM